MNPAIFRAYDIRGVYGTDFDAEFAQQLGSRIAGHLEHGALIVGRDGRDSSDELTHAIIDGALHAGASVIDAGMISSPQMYWAVRAHNAAGGVMVTASHNTQDYNGFKIVARRGDVLEILGGHHLRQIYDTIPTTHHTGGHCTTQDIIPGYADAVAYAAAWRGGTEWHLAVDAPEPVRRVLERFGPIASDDALAARFDADGDRLQLFDHGEQIPADAIFLLLVEQLGLQPVTFDLRFSRTVRTRLDHRGTSYFISRAGRLFMVLSMRHTGSVFGGELSGHYYWKEFGGMEAPELTLARLYAIVRASGQSLAELVVPYRVLAKNDEFNIPIRDAKHAAAMIRALEQQFPDGTQRHEDGLTVEYSDWWFTIHASNTEPVMRLTVEANTPGLLQEKTDEILRVIVPSAS